MRPFVFLLFVCSFHLQAQKLEVDDSYEVERLVRDVFVSGQCESITNIQRIGETEGSIGFFEGGDNSVGFSKGIILSTGKAKLAVGPNGDTDTGFEHSEDIVFDPDLDVASSGSIYDRTGIEFDFVPLSPIVTFRYVFASEEYCEFVGENFNDIFGFFISGPGINGRFNNGAINIAKIPDTDDPVSINSVNFRSNSRYYLDNEFPSVRDFANCGGGTGTGPRFSHIEYDGQTVILTATVALQVCQTYHLRLIISDIADNKLDSAVFLEAGSFNLGGSVSLQNDDGGEEPRTVYEGCTPGSFRVQRGADSDPRFPQTISYRIGRNSVARQGVDFQTGNGTITIPAGEDFALVPITAIPDNRLEGPESVWVYLDIPCACYTDSLEFFIDEPEEFMIGLEDAFYCPGQDIRLDARASGGVPPYRYQWSFGSTDSIPVLSPPFPTNLQLTVTDACGQSLEKDVDTFSSEPPDISLAPQDFRACRGDQLSTEVFLTGQAPFTLGYTVNDGRIKRYTFAGDSTQTWPVTEGGNYRLVEITDAACSSALDTTFRADFFLPSVNPRLTEPSCAGSSDGRIEITNLPTVAPYTFEFFGLEPDGLIYEGLPAGEYGVRVTDSLGCTDFKAITLQEPDPVVIPVIECNDVRRPPLRPSARGGVAPYTYSVDGRSYFTEDLFVGLEAGRAYHLRVRDSEGCEVSDDQFFWPKAAPRMARLPTFVPQVLASSTPVDVDYLVPQAQIVRYEWLPRELFDCPDCPQTKVTAPMSQPISLVLEGIYGCRDSLVTQVAIDGRVPLYVPNVFSPNGDGVNDVVTVFANELQVDRVLTFRIYTRWGGLMWEDTDFAPNTPGRGWNGKLNGRLAGGGAYVWLAEIRLITGELQAESGSIILMPGGGG